MKSHFLWLALALILVPLMPSSDSLWIDEGQTAGYVKAPSFGAWTERLVDDSFSEGLMPAGMLYPWAAARVLGTSELSLRIANLPWIMLLVVLLWHIGSKTGMPWLGLLAAVHPFVWAYANEARPYAMQMGAGSLAVYGLWLACGSRRGDNQWLYVQLSSALILSLIGLLGVITAGIAGVASSIIAWTREWRPCRNASIAVTVSLVLLASLGVYYLWKLNAGAGGAKLWTVGLGNIAFTAYEFGGFSGLGPSRQLLRSAAQQGGVVETLQANWPYAVGVGALAAAYGACFLAGGRALKDSVRNPFLIGAAIVFPASVAGLLALALMAGFPVWGRHHAPAFPFLLVILGFVLRGAWNHRPSGLLAVSALIGGLLLSSLILRFSPLHSKDDYRTAAEMAKRAGYVWWSADQRTAEYYGLSFSPSAFPGRALSTRSADLGHLKTVPPPRLAFLSKPEIYDPSGTIQSYLRERNYEQIRELQAFTVWQAVDEADGTE